MNAGAWLALSVVLAALWSGLLLTLTTILHPMYAARDPRGFAGDLQRFLPVARRSATNYLLVIGLLVAPALAIASLWDDKGSAPFLLTATGLALVLAGPFAVSRFLAEPNYDVIMRWQPDRLPADWTVARRRYFLLNWLRGALTWSALALFAAAAWIELG